MANNQHDSEAGEAVPTRFDDDELYRALAARERRRILSVLLDEPQCTRGDIATVLAGWRAGESETMVDSAEHEEIRLELRHHHLPQLADSGLVQYDRNDGTVTLNPIDDELRELIHRSIDAEM